MNEDYVHDVILAEEKIRQSELPKKKKIIMIVTLVALIVITLLSRQNSSLVSKNIARKPVEKLTISLEYSKVSDKKPQRINVERYPKDAIDDTLSWNVSDNNILEIKDGNMVYGKSKGVAKISLSSSNVSSNVIEVESVDFANNIDIKNSVSSIPIRTNHKYDIEVIPKSAENKEIHIISSNPEVISVKDKDNHIITGEKTGRANIEFVDTFGNILREETVEVKWERITGITIDETSVTMGKNQKYILYAEVKPETATYTDVIWNSLNPSVASINDSGIITAKEVGETTITATADDGKIVKKARVTVVNDAITNDIKYVSGNYPILAGASDRYEILGKTDTWSKVEILKDMKNGYYKIRTESGELGFVKNDTGNFLNVLPKLITGVPYISRGEYNLDNAPEMLVGSMLVKYIGIQATPNMVKNKFVFGPHIEELKNGDYVGSDPYKVFVGSVTSEEGTYGSYAEPLKKALDRIVKSNGLKYTVKNISGSSIDNIERYIERNIPVIVWSRVDGEYIQDGKKWTSSDGTEIVEKIGKTPIVITGYNDSYIIAADPLTSNNIKLEKSYFEKNYDAIGKQAVVIDKNDN